MFLEPSGSKETGKISFKILQELKKNTGCWKTPHLKLPDGYFAQDGSKNQIKLFVGPSGSKKTKKNMLKNPLRSQKTACAEKKHFSQGSHG